MRTHSILSLLLFSLLGACSGDELIGVHVKLGADGSGIITTRALMPLGDAIPIEDQAKGMKWSVRAGLVASQGQFQQIRDVTLGSGDVTFAPQLGGDRPGLRATFQRGPKTKWIAQLAPGKGTRQRMAKAYDPRGRTNEIGDVVRIEIAAPGQIITSGVLPTGRGVDADREEKAAVLLLPVAAILEEGDPFIWDISWLRSKQ
jgi:hypothetical protein